MATNKCILRTLLAAINAIFFCIAMSFVSLGIFIQRQGNLYLPDFNPTHLWAPWILFGIGTFVALASCIGCHAATLESKCLMMTYGGIMAISTIIMAVMAGIVHTQGGNIEADMAEILWQRLRTYGISDARYKITWDNIHTNLECCGITSYQDWVQNQALNNMGSVPDTCCRRTIEDCGAEQAVATENEAANLIFTDGCLTKLSDMLTRVSLISSAISVLSATLFIVTILTAFFIVCDRRISNEPTELIMMENFD